MIQETNRKPEPLLQGDNTRFTQLPYKYPDLQKAYKNHMSMFWTEDEIDYAADCEDFDNLNPEAKMFIEHVLAFFAGADGIVLENLINNFSSEVQASEARNFYGFQRVSDAGNILFSSSNLAKLAAAGPRPVLGVRF